MDRTTHACIAQESRSVRKNLLIGGLNVSVRADNSRYFAVEKSAKRYLFARGFSMDIDNDVRCLAADFRHYSIDSKKRIIQDRLHEGARLNVDDSNFSLGGFQNDISTPGRAV